MSAGLYDYMLFIAVILIFNALISMMCFIRVSVKYIDGELDRTGVGRPDWDSVGIRISMYAMAITFEKMSKTPWIPGENVRSLARRIDYVLAIWMQLSMFAMLIIAVILYPHMSE